MKPAPRGHGCGCAQHPIVYMVVQQYFGVVPPRGITSAFHVSQIQIPIQIESLHTRLDEIGEMTNTASLYSRTFS